MTQEQYYLNKLGKECFKLPERPKPSNLTNNNYLHDCLKLRPGFSQILDRKNCLSEFSMDEEKAEARSNLGITPLLEELSRLLDTKILTLERSVVEQTPSEEEDNQKNRVLSTYGLLTLLKNYYTKNVLDDEFTRLKLIIDNLKIVDDALDSESTNPVQNRIVKDALDGIYDVLLERYINPLISKTQREKDGNLVDVHQELDNKADSTELQNFYNKSEIQNKLDEIYEYVIQHLVDLSAVNELLELLLESKLIEINNLISNKANSNDVYSKIESDHKFQPVGNYLTEHQDIAGKANVGDSYTKEESDNKYPNKSDVEITGTVVNNNGYEYVDLGLPSGILWAKYNVGANSETEYGNYYMYGKGANQYNPEDSIYTGTEDPLDLSVDTARQVMGGLWYTPTISQMQELVDNTVYTWEENYNNTGINGGKFTASNGNYIFIPAAGFSIYSNSLNGENVFGFVWSSSLNSNTIGGYNSNNSALLLTIDMTGCNTTNSRFFQSGIPVRGIISPTTSKIPIKNVVQELKANQGYTKQESDNRFQSKGNYLTEHLDISGKADKEIHKVIINNNGHEYVDLGLPSGTLWAAWNVDASEFNYYGGYYKYGLGGNNIWSLAPDYFGTEEPLDISRDTAGCVMGGSWHTPTKELFEELFNNTESEWLSVILENDGFSTIINGRRFLAPNGNQIFLPASGYYDENKTLINNSNLGVYRTSTPGSDETKAQGMFFTSSFKAIDNGSRTDGCSVRGVLEPVHITKTVEEYILELDSDKVDSSNVYTKDECDNKFLPKGNYLTEHQDISGKADKTDVEIETTTFDANGHEYVDLGLPSGTLWATMNVGANNYYNDGNYYMYGKGSTLYNSEDAIYQGTEEPNYILNDTARIEWGGGWMTPTRLQILELIDNTTSLFEAVGIVDTSGRSSIYNLVKFIGTNGNYIYIPLSGYYFGEELTGHGKEFYLWSSTSKNNNYAYNFKYSNLSEPITIKVSDIYRGRGLTVRPVINPTYNISKVKDRLLQLESNVYTKQESDDKFLLLQNILTRLEALENKTQSSRYVTITQEEYNNLEEKDKDVIYLITG